MRKLCAFAVPFAAAVLASACLLPQSARLPAALLCALAGMVLCLALWGKERQDGRLRSALLALGLAVGFAWSWGYDAVFFAPARALAGQTASLTATVADWPEATRYGVSAKVLLHPPGAPDVRSILYFDSDEALLQLKPGDRLSFTAEFRLADTIAGEKTGYYRAKGVYLLGYCDKNVEMTPIGAVPPRFWPRLWARTLQETVGTLFSGETAGLVAALTTGDKGALSGGFYSALKRCGMAHVVAVSGMHVGMLVLLFTALTGKNRRRRARVCIPVVLAFMALTGFPPSVVRAGVMQILLLLGPALGREGDTPTALSFALLLLLLQNPNAVMDVGLQLSFLSVAGILTLGRRMTAWFEKRLRLKPGRTLPRRVFNRAVRFLTGCIVMTLGAVAFTTPLTVYYFGGISLIAPIANLLTLWAVTMLFLLALPAAVLGTFLPPLGLLLAGIAAPLGRYIVWVVTKLARLPFASASASGNPYLMLWLGFAYAVLMLWLIWRGEKKRAVLPVCSCAVTLAAALLLNALSLSGGGLAVSVLDVGQGQSVLFTSAGATVLVDCGGTGPSDPGDVAADAVQAMGKSRLDLLVLTHCHADHACGVARLFSRLEVGTLAVPDVEEDDPLREEILALARASGTEILLIRDDARMTFGESSLTVYAPLGDGGANEEGLSVLATHGDFDVLVTGDMNAAVEKRLVKYGCLPDIEVLVAGHHGSAASTSEELLLAAKPEYAIISVGYNSYGHPSIAAMERMAAAGCRIYRTDWMGTVTIKSET